MAIVVGIVGRLGEQATAKAFIKGVIDFTGPAFLVALARSVSVVMTNTKTIDTVLHAMEGLVTGALNATFILLILAGSLPLSFLVGGGQPAPPSRCRCWHRSATLPELTALW